MLIILVHFFVFLFCGLKKRSSKLTQTLQFTCQIALEQDSKVRNLRELEI